jgi:hypothetical protein
VSIFTIILDLVLVTHLARASSYGVSGLAITQSIVATVEVLILSVIMLKRDPKLFNLAFWGGVLRIVSVTGFSVVAGLIMVTLLPLGANDRGFLTLGTKLAAIAGVTLGVHVGISALFGLEEVRPIFSRLRKLFFRPLHIDY